MPDNRVAILQSSLELFAASGYDAIGVQQIVEAVGIKKPTLYHFFGSKRGVLVALMQEQFSPFVGQLKQAAAYQGDLPLSLEKVVACYFSFASYAPVLYQMHLSSWFTNPESEASQIITPYIKEQHQVIESLFELAANDHGNMKGRHQVYASTFLGMINTYIVQSWHHHLALNKQTAQQAVKQFSYGIYS
ncbi:TetR/AcrR family transcriptional regulator [Pontibacter sp. SGAir0037]|uniref:TetR/AcrR family transcriptional regulator n=1 Tax=Pontibacter sp. SGAir0037 TaxID=2571030 RepID=UPI0010CD1B54|nr:TetR/AcrR family transcriptional regulator [Pontibacter sp. SGAir0037]QCR22076.1 TetR/AcrR family transcriptional regulator [Pontibacter sp. SGAir0037]